MVGNEANGSRTARRSLASSAALALLCTLAAGCVERVPGEENLTPLWERYEPAKLSTASRGFVMRNVEVGGRVECEGDDYSHEQRTEVYARVRNKDLRFPAPVDKVKVQFEYLGGVMKGAISKKIALKADSVELSETLKVGLNGGAKCSCVRAMGIMWVFDKYDPFKMTTICPEKT